jgi:hypothetical protein
MELETDHRRTLRPANRSLRSTGAVIFRWESMGNASGIDYSTLVSWSAGIVAAQANCTLDDAITLMQERGVRTDRTLEEIADSVMLRKISFRD